MSTRPRSAPPAVLVVHPLSAAAFVRLRRLLDWDERLRPRHEFRVAHTTVRNGFVKVERLREIDPELARAIAEIEAELTAGAA